jgi:hypothetical protein
MEGIRQIEELIRQIESAGDPEVRARVRELVEAILDFHGAAIARMLELAGEGNPLVREFGRDELVAGMLLLYGLHPEDFETRVRRAVDALPNVQLTDVDEGRLRLRALNAGVTREAVEQAIYAAAPETEGIEIEGLAPAEPSWVPLEALLQG